MLEVGTKAPAFTLAKLGGGGLSLEEALAAGPAVLAFFKVSCPTCQVAMPFLERMAGSTAARLVAVSQDGPEATSEFHAEFGIKMPTLLDHQGYKTTKAFALTHVPSIFVVEPDGVISKSFTGFSKDDFEALGERLGAVPFLPGENVPRFKAG